MKRALVIYESMFGNTRQVAEVVARSLAPDFDVRLVRADLVGPRDLTDLALLVVGAPTHAWNLPRPDTRHGALNATLQPRSTLTLEPGAETSPGVREWLVGLGEVTTLSAVFDTRLHAPVVFTGHASTKIAKSLVEHGAHLALAPESFLVDRKNYLLTGELTHASEWGRHLRDAALAYHQVQT